MSEYSQAEIDELIATPKEIVDPPAKSFVEDRGHLKNDMSLESIDKLWKFKVFMRKNIRFPENFSVGLIYLPQDGTPSLTLIRCNGPHGEFNRNLSGHSHFLFHIHRADAELLQEGSDPLSNATKTEEYASMEEAIVHFCRMTSINKIENYFPTLLQTDMFGNPS